MAPGSPRPTIRVVHPTVGLQTLENLVLPVMINVAQGEWLQRRLIFCTVYDALLDDVQALDRKLESRFSREIIRIVSNFATLFDLQNQDIPEMQKFSQRIRSLGHKCQQPAAVQGLSGGTVLDYLVSLIAEKSRVKLDTVFRWQLRLVQLNMAIAIREVVQEEKDLRDKKGRPKKPRAKDVHYKEVGDEEVSEEAKPRKELLREIGLPSILFICVGPHKCNQGKNKDEKNGDEKAQDHEDHEDHEDHQTHGAHEAHEAKAYAERTHDEKNHGDHVIVHVVASSGEIFADTRLKRWAERMHNERMRSASLQNYLQVCSTERAFFSAQPQESGDGTDDEQIRNDTEKVRRANIVPYWQTMHHWPEASASTAGPGSETEARIGVFNHSNETAGAFSVSKGFKRRARCFKCMSIYLYRQDWDSISAEADMNGPHRTEITYDWTGDGSDDDDDENSTGPTCAEALGHLLCSEIL
ncbi:hypothetical protein F5883DRAFT_639461 [Diaporthe sp. PMI_573]|nr:hypothetical protein F5883DRAFT_639461 [Diaporthaceae sp. PMI_573]